jgi:hypothetical protein
MKKNELIERGFTTNRDGLVLDNSGNEYRNEKGSIEYLDGYKKSIKITNVKTAISYLTAKGYAVEKAKWVVDTPCDTQVALFDNDDLINYAKEIQIAKNENNNEGV